jgi:hypothetical protein
MLHGRRISQGLTLCQAANYLCGFLRGRDLSCVRGLTQCQAAKLLVA